MENMGLLSSTLNTPEQWRVWSSQGLDFILAEPGSDLRKFWDNATEHPQSYHNPQPEPPCSTPDSGPYYQPNSRPFSKPNSKSGEAGFKLNSQATKFAAAPKTPGCSDRFAPPISTFVANGASGFEQRSLTSIPGTTDVADITGIIGATGAIPTPQGHPQTRHASLSLLENLPSPWAVFAAKSKPGRALLWTYQELGLDLSGNVNPTRSELIKQIINALNLPAGSSNFWPHSLPLQTSGEQEFKQEPELFHRGFNALEPQFLLVFGETSITAIMPDWKCLPYTYTNYKNKVLIYLPRLEQLEDGQKFKKSIEFLQAFTLPCFGGGS